MIASLASADAASPADGHPRTVYFTTGDHQDLLLLPLDSQATIEAAFDAIHKRYQVGRVWWRGGQDEVWGNQFVIREENRPFWRLWEWWKDLQYRRVKTNRIAVEAAHKRGLEIWMAYGLFDNGSSADVGYSGFPYAAEDRLRVEHPEWTPVNKFGTWRQGGPIEFCYPQARSAMAAYLSRYVVEGGYDGIALLTYAENYSQRYDDEFGYNQPIVDEFKRRHGVDIRTEPFDKAAWSKLRGEYLTRFLIELRARLASHGQKIAVCVDGREPHLPTLWNVAGGVRTAGNVHLDLDTWAREGVVDEINCWAQASDESIERCLTICRDTATQVSAFRTRGDLPAQMQRIMFVGSEVESGFDWEHFIDWDDEVISPQPLDALEAGDEFARRRLLTSVLKGKQTLSVHELIAATRDQDVLVRRLALRALAKTHDEAAVPAVEAALDDAENSVRWQAALVLGELSGTRCIQRLLAETGREQSTFQFNYRAVPEVLLKLQADGKLGLEEKSLLVAMMSQPDPKSRELALYYFSRIGAPATPDVESILLETVRTDPNPYARELALVNLKSSFGPTASVLAAVRQAMEDSDDAVQVRAVEILASMFGAAGSMGDERARVLGEVIAFFRRYGENCRRTDAAWGWRVAGNALLLFGDDGSAALEAVMQDGKDRRLAELAWRVLYLRQGDQFFPITEAEDQAAHARHPFLPQASGK